MVELTRAACVELTLTFLLASECQNYAEAGRQLGITGTGVRGRIRKLESAFGRPLVSARGRFELTEFGDAVWRGCRADFRLLERNLRVVTEIRKEDFLSLAVTDYAENYYLPEILPAFSDKWPDIKIDVQRMARTEIDHAVATGIAMFGIGSNLERETAEVLRWFSDRSRSPFRDHVPPDECLPIHFSGGQDAPFLVAFPRRVGPSGMRLAEINKACGFILPADQNVYDLEALVWLDRDDPFDRLRRQQDTRRRFVTDDVIMNAADIRVRGTANSRMSCVAMAARVGTAVLAPPIMIEPFSETLTGTWLPNQPREMYHFGDNYLSFAGGIGPSASQWERDFYELFTAAREGLAKRNEDLADKYCAQQTIEVAQGSMAG